MGVLSSCLDMSVNRGGNGGGDNLGGTWLSGSYTVQVQISLQWCSYVGGPLREWGALEFCFEFHT